METPMRQDQVTTDDLRTALGSADAPTRRDASLTRPAASLLDELRAEGGIPYRDIRRHHSGLVVELLLSTWAYVDDDGYLVARDEPAVVPEYETGQPLARARAAHNGLDSHLGYLMSFGFTASCYNGPGYEDDSYAGLLEPADPRASGEDGSTLID